MAQPVGLGSVVGAVGGEAFLAVAFEDDENLVETVQDGAVLSPYALACISATAADGRNCCVVDVTSLATERDQEVVEEVDRPEPPPPAAAPARVFPDAGILKMYPL